MGVLRRRRNTCPISRVWFQETLSEIIPHESAQHHLEMTRSKLIVTLLTGCLQAPRDSALASWVSTRHVTSTNWEPVRSENHKKTIGNHETTGKPWGTLENRMRIIGIL